MMKKVGNFLGIMILIGLIVSCNSKNNNKSDNMSSWDFQDEILKQIKEPVFPGNQVTITHYGAVGDSVTDCTQAINEAIKNCAEQGGGKVVVPKGVFLTGAIHFKSNINLHLEEGATLLFSKDYSKYLPAVQTRFEGNDCMNYSPFIYGFGLENVALTGTGTLDGNADNETWWPWKAQEKYGWIPGTPNQLADRDSLLKMSDAQIPVEQRVFGEGHYLRPNFIQFHTSKNILIEGVTILRSPMWEIHPILSENIILRGVKIISHGPNNDGFDPESCKNILVEDCYFDTGDDCIAIKSGREEDGRRDNIPSENIIVRNCQMKDGHGGVVIGSEISGGCRNVFVENCKMDSPNLDRALRIKTNSLRGGVIENIYMRNCEIGEVKQAVLLVNFYYEQGDVGTHTPIVRNIFLDNITSEKSKYAVYLHGYERSPIQNIQINNSQFNGVKKDVFVEHADSISFNNVAINNKIFEFKN
ncbi:MAG: glycoside hydrolase [Bacteroidetes bacterium HGW-Bacteroidetes-4]|jgi:polygalacturonase|nr:MAG: glycoside hydrolase [Bacteroidetes bacterium HGW-Bacteroidetes-4]